MKITNTETELGNQPASEITIRQRFAMAAMQGICSASDEGGMLVKHGYEWTASEAVLLRRLHGDGRDRDEVETVCQLAETSIMNRESCADVMEDRDALRAQLTAAQVEIGQLREALKKAGAM